MSNSSDKFISVKISKELKGDFETFCARCGMTVSGAVSLLVSETLEENRLPFEITEKAIKRYENSIAGLDYQSGSIRVRIDPETRKEFANVCKSIGIPQGRIVKMFMLNCLDNGKLPF